MATCSASCWARRDETCCRRRAAAGAGRRTRQQARAVRPRRDAAFLRAAGQEHRAGRRQRLRLAEGARRARHSRAIRSSSSSSATSGCRRACSSRWAPACWSMRRGIVVTNFHVIRDADEVKVATVRRPRIREQDAAQGRVARPRRAQDRIAGAVSGDRHRQFRRARGRRPGARHRQSVRRRPDDDQRHRLGAGALAMSAFPISASSSRPTRRSIPAIPAAR